MTRSSIHLDVAIVGAGPVGLFLGHLLAQRGWGTRVFEREPMRSPWSRAIGIHPVSLELMDQVQLAATLIAAGTVVRRGHALRRIGDVVGSLDFSTLPGPYPFVLSLPQADTERILEEALVARHGSSTVARGHELVALDQERDRVTARFAHPGGLLEVEASFVIGCDGKSSTTRELAGLSFAGAPYPDHFVMGDFTDNTPFGDEAAIFLHREGLIESFPLPSARRRWVVRVRERVRDDVGDTLVGLVRERIGHDLSPAARTMESPFGVQHFVAQALVRERVLLAGDAAHIVSPIGGQGMNLGFKDAQRLAFALDRVRAGEPFARALARYDHQSRKVALRATRRAAFYMRLGRPRRHPFWRDQAIRLLLASPARELVARVFTMRGLERTSRAR